jgi:hypothetical protein
MEVRYATKLELSWNLRDKASFAWSFSILYDGVDASLSFSSGDTDSFRQAIVATMWELISASLNQ